MIKELAQYSKIFNNTSKYYISIILYINQYYNYELTINITENGLTVYHNKQELSCDEFHNLRFDSFPVVNIIKISNRLVNYILKELFIPILEEEKIGNPHNKEETVISTIIIDKKMIEQTVTYKVKEYIECVKIT